MRKLVNSLALCAKLLGTSKAPKHVAYRIFLSSGATSVTQPRIWSPQSIGLLKRVENVQRRATKLILKLPFRCDVTYKSRLQLTNLLPISYWHEFLDTVFFYKSVTNLVFADCETLPVTRRLTRYTRSSSSNAITYIPKQSRTVTYERSFFLYARAAHGMFCPMSYAPITFLWLLLNAYYSNTTIGL